MPGTENSVRAQNEMSQSPIHFAANELDENLLKHWCDLSVWQSWFAGANGMDQFLRPQTSLERLDFAKI